MRRQAVGGGPALLEDGLHLIDWAASALTAAGLLSADIISDLASGMEKMIPEDEYGNDAKMLSDEYLQNMLFLNPRRQDLNPGVANI